MPVTSSDHDVEQGLVPVRELPIEEIRPAPQNEKLYRPVVASDPEVQSLAQSIQEHGVLEPLVVSIDMVIISGHRRHTAAREAGLKTVPCRVEDIHSSSPRFMVLLREANRQRIKSSDEVMREEVVSASPDEAYCALLEHRKNVARVKTATITIAGKTHRCKISGGKGDFLKAILKVLEDRKDFWPLTDRSVHYGLLNDPPLRHAKKPDSRYANNKQCYKDLCDMLTRARLTGQVAFDAIHDPTRPAVTDYGFLNTSSFFRHEFSGFLKGYYRDLQQSQPNHIEIIGEKNTIDSIIRPVANEYCIPMTIGRGYSSLPPRHHMAQRFKRSGRENLVLLVLSDFDPEGEDIAHSFARSMRDDFGVANVEPIKVALTTQQVQELDLPPMMKAKAKSSRRKKFVEKHGDDVFELEAVPPARLQTILRSAIDSVLDVRAFNAEMDAEKQDAAVLDRTRRQVSKALERLELASV